MSRSRHPPPEQVTPLFHGGTFFPVVLKEQRFLGHRQPFPHEACYLSAPRQETCLVTGLATARQMGADYPFEDLETRKWFNFYGRTMYGWRFKRA